MSNVFISYAHEDSEVAYMLREMLVAEGQSVFFDQAIAAGENFTRNIEKALTDAKVVVVLLSRNSNRSRWVNAELRSALQSGKIVIPVLLDDEATNNWVWPLVSDRNAIKLGSPRQIAELVREVNRAVGYINMPQDKAKSTAYSHRFILLIAVLSSLITAIIMWLTR